MSRWHAEVDPKGWRKNTKTEGIFNLAWIGESYSTRDRQIDENKKQAEEQTKRERDNQKRAKINKKPDPFNGKLGERTFDADDKYEAIKHLYSLTVQDTHQLNPKFARTAGAVLYRKNCALCTSAFAVSMHGYDVEAMPRDYDSQAPDGNKGWRGFNKIFDVDYSNPDNYILSGTNYRHTAFPSKSELRNNGIIADPPKMPKGAKAAANAIVKKVEGWGNGAYGELDVTWDDYPYDVTRVSGHGLIIFNLNNKVFLFCPQSGELKSSSKEGLADFLTDTVPARTELARLDNAKIKSNIPDSELFKMLKVKKKDKLEEALDKIDWSKF